MPRNRSEKSLIGHVARTGHRDLGIEKPDNRHEAITTFDIEPGSLRLIPIVHFQFHL